MSPAFAAPRVLVNRRSDGSILLDSPHPLGDYPRHVGDRLRHWAAAAPARVFLAEREGPGLEGWRKVGYREAAIAVARLAEGLVHRGLSAERPLVILSDNGIDHALLTLAAMHAGVPVAPISPAYSLLSSDLEKLRAIAAIVRPGAVWASDADRFRRAFDALAGTGATMIASRGATGATLPISALYERDPTDETEARFLAQGPDSVAKILFTSGSTGLPKGVINTQRMLTSNQRAIEVCWPFLRERPPVVLDWLPWSHTFGANHNFNMVLFHGGTLFVDDGKPTPDLVARTAKNLLDVSPTMYFNVPRGFDMLLPFLEQDEAVRAAFFRDLDVVFYAAASLPHPLWERLEAASKRARGEVVSMLSAWGSTETAPMSTTVHFPIERAGVIGLPAPGTTIKLAPVGGKMELRVKGPNVTPGYLDRPDLTASAFDEEGFYRTGDGGKFVDPEEPSRGVAFDGRIAEDFKLASGTWVHVGAVRTAAVAAGAPLVQDIVVAGLDREEIGFLVFLSPLATRGIDAGEIQSRLEALYRAYNRVHPGSSQRVGRLVVLSEPPSIDANEITDKGYINQRAVLARRSDVVEEMYTSAGEGVIRFGG